MMETSSSEGMKEKLVYHLAADATCLFEDGESIQINRTMLAFHSKFFMEAFFGPEPVAEIKIEGFDRESFKTFLDCLFGLKEYTTLDALLIYPIAHQYDVKDSLEKCTATLKPKQMNEDLSLVLNLSTFYKCRELTDFVLNFIKKHCGVISFLENERYRNLLDPLAIVELIKNSDLNSLLWTFVYEWGEKYLKDRDGLNIQSLFRENGITANISSAHFESAQAIIDFGLSTNNQLLSYDQILRFLQTNMKEKNVPDKSVWLKIESGDSFTEKINFKRCVLGPFNKDPVFSIKSNKILIEPRSLIFDVVQVKVRYFLRECKWPTSNPIFHKSLKNLTSRWHDFNFFFGDTPSELFYNLSSFFPIEPPILDFNVNDDINGLCLKFEAKPNIKIFEIHSVEVTYTFHLQCRILKTSLNNFYLSDDKPDMLFFTKDVNYP